jgi:hypothetical protein
MSLEFNIENLSTEKINKHLSSLELNQNNKTLSELLDMFSEQITDTLKADKYTIQGGEYHLQNKTFKNLYTKNNALIYQFIFFLMSNKVHNFKGIILSYYKQRKTSYENYDLLKMANIFQSDEIQKIIQPYIQKGNPVNDEEFLLYMKNISQYIQENNMLGKSTKEKFGHLRVNENTDIVSARDSARWYIGHIIKYKERIKKNQFSNKDNDKELNKIIVELVLYYRINELSKASFSELSFKDTVIFFADEIAYAIGLNYCETSNPELEYSFLPRNISYFEAGTRYGDCTARKNNDQIDKNIKNIFWTKAAWFLDPSYQILEVSYNKEALIKTHMFPGYLDDTPIFFLDATETVVKIRKYLTENKENKHLNKEAFAKKEELLHGILEQSKLLAEKLGIENIFTEQYSNTDWVRDYFMKINKQQFYNINQLHRGSMDTFVYDMMNDLFNLKINMAVEIQTKNTQLIQQSLRPNMKEVSIICGNELNVCRQTIAGI